MSLLLLEGFDDGLWDKRLGGPLTSAHVGSSYGLNGNGARVGDTPNIEFTVPVPYTELFTIGFAIKIVANGAAADAPVVIFKDSFTELKHTQGGELLLRVQGSATPDINWTAPAALGEWHYVEIQMEHGNSSDGTVKFWFDGTLINSTTTFDFYQPLVSSVQFGDTGTSDVDDAYFDNIYVTDSNGSANTGNLGPLEVAVLLPDGNGNSSDLVGSDSNSTDNYLLVDNNAAAPPATTEYVGSDTEGDKDTYTMDDLSGTPIVKGVVVSLYAAKTDSGAKYLRPVVRTSSTDYAGDSEGLAESYSLHEHAWDQNPNTSAAWLYGAVNGMEVGQEVRDS